MDKVVAKSDFLYDEDTLLTYYKAREARTFKLFGIFILLLGLLFLLTAFVVLSLKGEPLGILLFFIAAAVISGIGIWLIATGNFPANLDTYERSRFFKRQRHW